jgi:thiamine transport system permease protein
MTANTATDRTTTEKADRRVLAGLAALAVVAVMIGGAGLGLVVEGARDGSGALSAIDARMLGVMRFTLWQAVLSTLLSVLPAVALARALSRHPSFPGSALLIRLFAVPLGLPAIVAALGLLELYGRNGWIAGAYTTLTGAPWAGIYGLSGILIAHVFFNLPLATRLFLEALDTVPNDQWRLAAQLGMGARASFRLIEWPVLRSALPGVAGLVFMLCVTSFTLVLTLGGGPGATTLEVEIYQALRFDFDPARAVVLTVLQVLLTVVVVVALRRLGADMTADGSAALVSERPPMTTPTQTAVDLALIAAAGLFVATPMLSVVVSGLAANLARLATSPRVLSATATSLVLAILAATLSVVLALSLASARQALASGAGTRGGLLERLTDAGASFVLVVPPIVIGAGWFVLLRRSTDVLSLAPVMVVTVNALMAMPFALRILRPAHDAAAVRHDRLCASLGIAGWSRLRLVDLPVLARPLLTALAFAMALSLGDLGVIALFGSDAVQTLPALLYASLGSYRTADAAGIALLLGALCLGLVALGDRIGRGATR